MSTRIPVCHGTASKNLNFIRFKVGSRAHVNLLAQLIKEGLTGLNKKQIESFLSCGKCIEQEEECHADTSIAHQSDELIERNYRIFVFPTCLIFGYDFLVIGKKRLLVKVISQNYQGECCKKSEEDDPLFQVHLLWFFLLI
jgi:hypothetical protein